MSSLAAETYDYWGDPHEQDAGQIWIPESVVEFPMRVVQGQALTIDSRLRGVVVDVLNKNPKTESRTGQPRIDTYVEGEISKIEMEPNLTLCVHKPEFK